MQLGILLLVAAGLTWVAIGAVISRSAARGLNLNRIQAEAALVCLLVSALALLWPAGSAGRLPSPVVAGLLVLAGAANYVTFLLMNRAMRQGHNGIVWSVVQSALVWPFLMGVLVFGVSCTWLRVLGLALILIGIGLAGFVRDGACSGSGARKWIGAALAAFLAAGASQCLANLPSYLDGAEFGSVGKAAALQLGTLAAFGVEACGNARVWRGAVNWKPVAVLAGANIAAQYFFFYRGLDLVAQAGAGSIGYPIVLGSCIGGFSLYSALVLHERVTAASAASVACCLAGIIVLAC